MTKTAVLRADIGNMPAKRLRRADAIRNRERLFAVAKERFAEAGASVGMEDIAKSAGVGVGTLYRAFGSRSGLAEAVYRDMVKELTNAAARLAAEDKPWEALVAWLKEYVSQLQSKRAMIGALQPLFDRNPALLSDSRLIAANALSMMLKPAQDAGEVRADLRPADLMQLINGMVAANIVPAKRITVLLEIVLAGIRIR